MIDISEKEREIINTLGRAKLAHKDYQEAKAKVNIAVSSVGYNAHPDLLCIYVAHRDNGLVWHLAKWYENATCVNCEKTGCYSHANEKYQDDGCCRADLESCVGEEYTEIIVLPEGHKFDVAESEAD